MNMYEIIDKEKADRFHRVAERRTNNAIEEIRKLGNCGNKQNYLYTEDEVRKVFEAIEKEIESAKSKFPYFKEKSRKFSL
jgi:hypothetical protein